MKLEELNEKKLLAYEHYNNYATFQACRQEVASIEGVMP